MSQQKICFYSRGEHTHHVPNILHRLNRQRLLERLQSDDRIPKNSIVVLKGGESETRFCSDNEPVFRQESYFHWTFGVQEPDYFGAIHLESGKSFLFAPEYCETYQHFMGPSKSFSELQTLHGVDEVHCTSSISEVLQKFKPQLLLIYTGFNSDSKKYASELSFPGNENFNIDKKLLNDHITECRVFKTNLELEVMRYVNRLSSEAHKDVMRKVRIGMKEYQIESLFKHYCYYNGGARHEAYTCICGSGINGSILHYGHAGASNGKTINDGDMLLFDMGVEYYGYTSDITCSFPANGVFNDKQKIIYNAVLQANYAVRAAVKPGISWVDMHLLAERIELEELKKNGLLQGDIEEMLEARLGAIFMPHGLGHFMGCDTHDVGGYLEHCPPRRTEPGLCNLRTARVLEEGMVLTIEPGIYFIKSLLNKAYSDPKLSKFLIRERIQDFENFGGVRIEDDVYITSDGMELLTQVPRTIEDIEKLMNEGKNIDVEFPQKFFINNPSNGYSESSL